MTSYVLILGSNFVSREQAQAILDNIPEVTHWYACLPNCIFFTSSLNAQQLADRFISLTLFSQNRRFLIMEANSNRQGWLPRRAWTLLRFPDRPTQ